jgi:hypothetical protein
VKATRIVLFSLLGATILAGVVLYFVSNSKKGPAHSFTLVPSYRATSAQLDADAAAMVRRLQSNGYPETQASVSGQSVRLTMYGQVAKVDETLESSLTPGAFNLRPIECVAPAYEVVGSEGVSSGTSSSTSPSCAPSYLLKASSLAVDTRTGKPTGRIVADPALGSVVDTSASADKPSRSVLLPVSPTSALSQYRVVAGPTTLTGEDISSVAVSKSGGSWRIDLSLSSQGATRLDSLATRQFHSYIAFDIDAKVVSALLIEPTGTYFTSLDGAISFDASFDSKPQATGFADALTSPLAVPLRVASGS